MATISARFNIRPSRRKGEWCSNEQGLPRQPEAFVGFVGSPRRNWRTESTGFQLRNSNIRKRQTPTAGFLGPQGVVSARVLRSQMRRKILLRSHCELVGALTVEAASVGLDHDVHYKRPVWGAARGSQGT